MDLFEFFRSINSMIADAADEWWVVPLIFLFCLIDGFFIFLPSETAIIAVAAVAASTGEPNAWYLLAGGALGAAIGDNIAYWMGRGIGTAGFKWMQRPRMVKATAWAEREFDRHGAVLVLTGRYIPVGRVAVNFTAGAIRFPWRTFVWVDAIACFLWAGYGVMIGTFAGQWIRDNHLLGILISVVVAIFFGFVLDFLIRQAHQRLGKRQVTEPEAENPVELSREQQH